jgi:hypothetical protein
VLLKGFSELIALKTRNSFTTVITVVTAEKKDETRDIGIVTIVEPTPPKTAGAVITALTFGNIDAFCG